MQDYGTIKSVIELIETNETALRQKVVTQEHYELSEPYVCLRVLSSQTDRPHQSRRAKVTISVEVLSKYSGILEIVQVMNRLQQILNQMTFVNVHGEAQLEFTEAKIVDENDGRRRGVQLYTVRVNLHP